MGDAMSTNAKELSASSVAPNGPPPSQRVGVVLIVAVLALVPVVSSWLGQSFYTTIVTRIMVFGLAALGLNLVLGFGAMVSLGHAMYIGIGAYAVGMLASHGILSGSGANLIYTPTNNYNGPDSFTYTVNDSSLTSAVATVSSTSLCNQLIRK